MRAWAIGCIVAIFLTGCGGGGGSSMPSATSPGGSVQQVAVQQALVQQSLSSLSSIQWITLGSAGPLALGYVRQALSSQRRVPQSCSNGVDVEQTGNSIIVNVYSATNCTGQLLYTLQLTVTQTSSTVSTATGSETFYASNGAVYEYVRIANLTVSTATGSQYFTLQATVATSSLGTPYQSIGVGCSTASRTESCSVGVANHIAAIGEDNTMIETETATFTASGSNTVIAITGSGSAFTGPYGSTSIQPFGTYAFIETGGTLVFSSGVNGSFTMAASGLLSAATFAIAAAGGNAAVSFNGTSYAGTVTANGGGTLATFTIDAGGNGSVTYSDGSGGTISNFSIISSPIGGPSISPEAFTCPTSDAPSSVARSAPGSIARRMPLHAGTARPSSNLLAVTYDRAAFARSSTVLSRAETANGATLVRALDFPHTGRVMHVLSVPSGSAQTVVQSLRAQNGVIDVAPAGERRYATTVNAPYFPNDPYFDGFSPANVPPYYESSALPGQWDMHAIGMQYAFAYSQPANGSSVGQVPAALGSNTIKLAIVDTGEDPNHPEMAQIGYQKCFITTPGGAQSTSNFETDPEGHGTNVAGIAAAAIGNGLGFTGAGGKTSIYAYRVFPTPDATCFSDPSAPECGAQSLDIAAAINDAVTQNVNVISLSLGGGGCSGGVDSDPIEGQAIADAIAANVVVVAASGNDGAGSLYAPACDSGVIAVGATSLDDGQPNGSNHVVGSASSPIEYVGSYSNYGSPAAAYRSATAWGIVAPGGDPSSVNDADQLHWIENVWTSTPFSSNDAGNCNGDYPSSTGTADCRILIAGTSQAAPHVAGVAALILALPGGTAYQSPSAMKTLLCATADQINDAHEGCGRLNAYRAVATALGDTPLP